MQDGPTDLTVHRDTRHWPCLKGSDCCWCLPCEDPCLSHWPLLGQHPAPCLSGKRLRLAAPFCENMGVNCRHLHRPLHGQSSFLVTATSKIPNRTDNIQGLPQIGWTETGGKSSGLKKSYQSWSVIEQVAPRGSRFPTWDVFRDILWGKTIHFCDALWEEGKRACLWETPGQRWAGPWGREGRSLAEPQGGWRTQEAWIPGRAFSISVPLHRSKRGA